jgi:hypothetical protein
LTSRAIRTAAEGYPYHDRLNVLLTREAVRRPLRHARIRGDEMSFRVTYNGNGSTGGAPPVDSTNYASGATVTVQANTLTKSGASFGYWNTSADGTGTDFDAGNTFTITSDTTLYAQWYVTDGLTNGGATAHYTFSYHERLKNTASNPSGPEPARTNAVIAACESDWNLMSGWFNSTAVTGMTVMVTPRSNGAYWFGGSTSSTVRLKPGQTGYGTDPVYLRYLIVSEVTEIFMLNQNAGWFQGGNEGSKGEGLSRFLGARFLDVNGFAQLQLRTDYGTARLWLNSTRADYVNNAPDDNGYDAVNGCTALFIWYLFSQLGFTERQIVAAAGATLADVYRNLTGDVADPFPFFKSLLDAYYPSTTSSAIAGANPDNPWPLTFLSFWVDKSTFGRDEVHDVTTPPQDGSFTNAFWLVVEGLNRQVLASAIPTLSGAATTVAGMTLAPNAAGAQYEFPGDARIPQRVRFPYDARFTSSALGAFPQPGGTPTTLELDGSFTAGGHTATAATILELVAGADPYFTNVNPALGNVSWLSQDLRVFTATPANNNHPVPGGPQFASDSVAGGYAYVQALLAYLNANYGDPSGVDPFDAASNVIPGQAGALTGDSSVTPTTSGHANYNFAVARVRLRGSQGSAGAAQNVKVFFRMWGTQTADTDYQPASTYLSHLDARNLPDWPLAPSDSHTLPMFATSAAPNLADPNNPEYGAAGVNNRTITVASGDVQWAYFGCFLNVYDPANVVNGSPIQALLPGTHHCLVAQIAYDDAPIVNANGVTMSPGTSDKLAQRNLQITHSDNPGGPATHMIPQTFDLRASAGVPETADVVSGYPDELMIDWGNTPVGSTASIYWPQVAATDVLATASAIYSSHRLSASDAHTIQCPVTAGVTYLPIPAGTGQRLAGLLTIDLPSNVVKGQEFDVVLRRVRTRSARFERPVARPAVEPGREPDEGPTYGIEGQPDTPIAKERRPYREQNWRYVTGTFQVKIPVSTATHILPAERDTLAIFKWRLQQMSPTNRWYPVLERYVALLAARVDGLGGDAGAIPPSPQGAPQEVRGHEHEVVAGVVREVLYDCTGRVERFVLGTCCTQRAFRIDEPRLARLLVDAMRHRLRVVVTPCTDEPERVRHISLQP